MLTATKFVCRFMSALFLLFVFNPGNFAFSADCMPLDGVESLRQRALSARDDHLAAAQEYLAALRKVNDMRTTVYECQSGQTLTGSIFGSCNEVIMKYNLLADRTNNLESRRDSLQSLAQAFIGSYQSAASSACKQ